MNYTPGPWTVEVDHATDTAEFIRAHLDGESFDVASVLCDETGNATENARLIAAAPDLLAALRLILDSEETHGDSVVCDFETLQSVARAAVVKAIGE